MALLGYSEGSWVALRAADRAGVDRLVLCSAPIVEPRRQTAFHWASDHRHWPAPLRTAGAALTWLVMGLSDYGRHDARPHLRVLRAPVLLVLGGADPTLNLKEATTALERLCASRHEIVVVSGAGHGLPAEGSWLPRVVEWVRNEGQVARLGSGS